MIGSQSRAAACSLPISPSRVGGCAAQYLRHHAESRKLLGRPASRSFRHPLCDRRGQPGFNAACAPRAAEAGPRRSPRPWMVASNAAMRASVSSRRTLSASMAARNLSSIRALSSHVHFVTFSALLADAGERLRLQFDAECHFAHLCVAIRNRPERIRSPIDLWFCAARAVSSSDHVSLLQLQTDVSSSSTVWSLQDQAIFWRSINFTRWNVVSYSSLISLTANHQQEVSPSSKHSYEM